MDSKDNSGLTPINWASRNGNFEVVKYLCEICHANITIKDNNGYAPINWASENDHQDIVNYLLSFID